MKLKPLCRKISFLSDGYLLAGTLHIPAGDRPPVVIGSHGLLSSSDSPKQLALAEGCNRNGIAYFRFDHRGCGTSQGYFPEVTSLQSRAADLRSALGVIRSRPELGERIGLFGSSMGGATCLAVAGEAAVDVVVTYAAPVRGGHIRRTRTGNNDDGGISPLPNGFSLQFDLTDKLSEIHNLLILHGDADSVVPFSDAEQIYRLAGEPKRLIRLEQGDHPMSRKDHQKLFARETLQWLVEELAG
jgi:alpha-beta hydrolase superfamily lysophospholipase